MAHLIMKMTRRNWINSFHCTSMHNKPVHNIHLPTLQGLQHSCPMESAHKWDFHSFCQSLGSLLLHSRRTHATEADHGGREEGMPSWSATNSWQTIHLCTKLAHRDKHLFADSLTTPSNTLISKWCREEQIKTNMFLHANTICEKPWNWLPKIW